MGGQQEGEEEEASSRSVPDRVEKQGLPDVSIVLGSMPLTTGR